MVKVVLATMCFKYLSVKLNNAYRCVLAGGEVTQYVSLYN